MSVNYELKGLIYSKYGKETELAKHLDWSRQKLNKLTTGRKMPDLEELNSLSIALDEPVDKLIHIFLRSKSPNGQQTRESA